MHRIIAFIGLAAFLLAAPAAAEEHSLFTEILNEHVSAGHVRYTALCRDRRLPAYLEQLSKMDPASRRGLTFWLNLYNAHTLQVICESYPVKSINDLHAGGVIRGTSEKGTIWDSKVATVDGDRMSLNHIEHEIIRRKFREPRIHFALVCAAASCPPLRSEAYEAEKLERQLEEQALAFFADAKLNRFEPETRTAYLSKILYWYSGDFGKSKEDVLLYVAQYLRAEIRKSIEADPPAWTTHYTEYDWALNE
jgi:hypothetical protein